MSGKKRKSDDSFIRRPKRKENKESIYRPRVIGFALEYLQSKLVEKLKLDQKFESFTKPFVETVVPGPNTNNYLIPPEYKCQLIFRKKNPSGIDWRDAELLAMELFGSEETTGSKNRSIDQRLQITDKLHAYLEIKKSSGWGFNYPRTIQSSLKQIKELSKKYQEEKKQGCLGSFYLILSDDFLKPKSARQKEKYITFWLVDASDLKGWRAFNTKSNEVFVIES